MRRRRDTSGRRVRICRPVCVSHSMWCLFEKKKGGGEMLGLSFVQGSRHKYDVFNCCNVAAIRLQWLHPGPANMLLPRKHRAVSW